MRFFFSTLGCKLNFAESSSLGRELIARGHTCVSEKENADICILNTCSVTDAADHKGRLAIHRLHREHPNALIIVTGCYAQLKAQEIKQIEGVDYVIGSNEKFQIPDLIDQIETQHTIEQPIAVSPLTKLDTFYPSVSAGDRTRCFLKIQDGCDYFCTYCTIPLARGRSRNAPIEQITKQIEQVVNSGTKEIILTGVNIGDFGKSTGEDFLSLLKAIDNLEGSFRIRISSCEPNLLSDEIIEFVAQSNHFAPHFHIPLQSGSNQVLKIMRRRYTREVFQERVERIRQLMPTAFIGVDCMVGVRGEKDEYFNDYLSFIRSLDVSQLHVFTYSERENTKMLSMDLDIIPKSERKRRSDILHQVSEQKLQQFYASCKGRQATVLWESKVRGGKMSGFTENYIRIERNYDRMRINTFETIVI